ncbi:unnamed protein product [Vitrella brassicaformis CCMP3155]|uniref:Uncharacterized protein n=1 Tax=Vitrella brassicaformis (strain CCMP3155) TaxID=1169540 RepID=A0A0G4G094_VITBC|nr:unnamed protein product [Vitrella brassicaformis CCMP3155]|eukprot:CEM21281.1 unnamed protein product [Vitrella brassicaformis CCMP3155]
MALFVPLRPPATRSGGSGASRLCGSSVLGPDAAVGDALPFTAVPLGRLFAETSSGEATPSADQSYEDAAMKLARAIDPDKANELRDVISELLQKRDEQLIEQLLQKFVQVLDERDKELPKFLQERSEQLLQVLKWQDQERDSLLRKQVAAERAYWDGKGGWFAPYEQATRFVLGELFPLLGAG